MTKTRGRHEGSVYQRSDGRFVAEISVGYKLNGKRDKRSSYHKTKQEATKALSKLRNEQETQTLSNARGITFETHLKSWLEFKKPSLKARTLHTYQDYVKRLIVPKLGKIKLEKLSPLQLDQYYKALLDQGYAPRTPRVVHTFIYGALKQALCWGLVARNVADAATPPKAARNEMKFWKPEEAMNFLEFAKPHRLHALFYVALLTGLRCGELRGLRWEDIDLTHKRLFVRQNLSQFDGAFHFDTPKTRKSQRTVFIEEETVAVLRAHLERQTTEKLFMGEAWKHPELVFTSAVGTPLDQRNLQRQYKNIIKASGVPDIRFHDLRHTSASLLIRQGVNIKLVSDRLGHSNTSFTNDVYIHLYEEQRQQAAMSLTDLCRPSSVVLN